MQGNLLPQEIIDKQKSGNKDKVFDLDYDSEYIYAAFLQAYNIDLFEVQGKLHWKKFNALLSSLPENTRFMEIIKIRSWKPNGETAKEKEKMRKLQREYALPQNL